MSTTSPPEPDLIQLTAQLVGIPSVSRNESGLCDYLERRLGSLNCFRVSRIRNNLVLSTEAGRDSRVVLAGHLDTVPASPAGHQPGYVEIGSGSATVAGLGAVDMKGGLAVLVALAETIEATGAQALAFDTTLVFYECEEIDRRFNGLGYLLANHPDLVKGDVAVLAEPTGARLEAGCQGTLRLRLELAGRRAHTARPWTGMNAIHRAGPVLAYAASYVGRQPVLDGCRFREALQVVRIEGGIANNVVPDSAQVVLNHRFAPDRSLEDARRALVDDLAGCLDLEARDEIVLEDGAPGARPNLSHPLLSSLVSHFGDPATAKLGWTDVATFAEAGIPAVNLGPGDPNLAHSPAEVVHRAELDACFRALWRWMAGASPI